MVNAKGECNTLACLLNERHAHSLVNIDHDGADDVESRGRRNSGLLSQQRLQQPALADDYNPYTIPSPSKLKDAELASEYRWLILFLSCWIMFGNYYAFDNPSALNRQLQEWFGGEPAYFQYILNLMYCIY